MNTVVNEHVALTELRAAWRTKLRVALNTHVTVRIDEEHTDPAQTALTDNPLFGMWRDGEETADVTADGRGLRAPS